MFILFILFSNSSNSVFISIFFFRFSIRFFLSFIFTWGENRTFMTLVFCISSHYLYFLKFSTPSLNFEFHSNPSQSRQTKKPRWLDFHEQKLSDIRPKISYISVILECQNSNTPLKKHQKSINAELVKWYRNPKHSTLMAELV